MKKILFACLLGILCFTACQPRELPSKINITESEIELRVSHQSTKPELDKFKSELEAQGFKMDFTGSEFGPDGKVTNLKFSVTTPKNSGAAGGAKFSDLKYNYYGFVYNKERGEITVGELKD